MITLFSYFSKPPPGKERKYHFAPLPSMQINILQYEFSLKNIRSETKNAPVTYLLVPLTENKETGFEPHYLP